MPKGRMVRAEPGGDGVLPRLISHARDELLDGYIEVTPQKAGVAYLVVKMGAVVGALGSLPSGEEVSGRMALGLAQRYAQDPGTEIIVVGGVDPDWVIGYYPECLLMGEVPATRGPTPLPISYPIQPEGDPYALPPRQLQARPVPLTASVTVPASGGPNPSYLTPWQGESPPPSYAQGYAPPSAYAQAQPQTEPQIAPQPVPSFPERPLRPVSDDHAHDDERARPPSGPTRADRRTNEQAWPRASPADAGQERASPIWPPPNVMEPVPCSGSGGAIEDRPFLPADEAGRRRTAAAEEEAPFPPRPHEVIPPTLKKRWLEIQGRIREEMLGLASSPDAPRRDVHPEPVPPSVIFHPAPPPLDKGAIMDELEATISKRLDEELARKAAEVQAMLEKELERIERRPLPSLAGAPQKARIDAAPVVVPRPFAGPMVKVVRPPASPPSLTPVRAVAEEKPATPEEIESALKQRAAKAVEAKSSSIEARRQKLREGLARMKDYGFVVTRLEALIDGDIDIAEREFSRFERDIQRLIDLRNKIKRFSAQAVDDKALASASKGPIPAPSMIEPGTGAVPEDHARNEAGTVASAGEPKRPLSKLIDAARGWEREGYVVAPLMEVLQRMPESAESVFSVWEKNIRELAEIRQTLEALTKGGDLSPSFAAEIESIMELSTNPEEAAEVNRRFRSVMERMGYEFGPEGEQEEGEGTVEKEKAGSMFDQILRENLDLR